MSWVLLVLATKVAPGRTALSLRLTPSLGREGGDLGARGVLQRPREPASEPGSARPLLDQQAPPTSSLELICECGDLDCVERINVEVSEYEHARSDPRLFLAKPGHIDAEAKQVVAERGDHQLVRKTGDAAAVAEERDPRS